MAESFGVGRAVVGTIVLPVVGTGVLVGPGEVVPSVLVAVGVSVATGAVVWGLVNSAASAAVLGAPAWTHNSKIATNSGFSSLDGGMGPPASISSR